MGCYDFVLASMYRYSWLVTFDIFRNFFFWIEGWVGGVYRIQTFFGFLYIFYIYKAPNATITRPARHYKCYAEFIINQRSIGDCNAFLLNGSWCL